LRFSPRGPADSLKILLRAGVVGFAEQCGHRRVELAGALNSEVVSMAAGAERLGFDQPGVGGQQALENEPDPKIRFSDSHVDEAHAHHEHHARFLRDHRRRSAALHHSPQPLEQPKDMRLAFRE
jgi:hypothetical protein